MLILPFVLLFLVVSYEIFVVINLLKYNCFSRDFDQTHPVASKLPGISVLIPIKGPVAHLQETLGSVLAQKYPGELQVILAFQDAKDPSLPEAEKMAKEVQGSIEVKILRGLPFLGFNPKNSNLVYAIREARHDWFFTCDIDTRIGPYFLRRAMTVTEQKTDRYATAITIHEGAKTLGALLETIGTNLSLTSYFLMVYLHSKKPGPINGAAHLFNRELLKRIGGIEIILNVLTEDAVFEKAFLKNGGRGVLAPDFVRVTQESQTLKGFWSRYVRWMLIARCYFPLSFISPIFWIGQWLLIFGFLGLPGETSPVFIACGLAVFASRVLTSFVCQILQRTPVADWPKAMILILSDSIMPFLWVWSRFGRHVQWAGKLLRVERNGSLVFVEKR